jgi:hypothetical protein
MNQFKMTTAALCLLTLSFAPSMRADERNKETNITTSQEIQIGSTVLPPGQYVLKLAEPDSNLTVVNIFDAAGRLHGVVLGTTAYRMDVDDKSAVTFTLPQGSRPGSLKWFYPGDNFGVEFQVR